MLLKMMLYIFDGFGIGIIVTYLRNRIENPSNILKGLNDE